MQTIQWPHKLIHWGLRNTWTCTYLGHDSPNRVRPQLKVTLEVKKHRTLKNHVLLPSDSHVISAKTKLHTIFFTAYPSPRMARPETEKRDAHRRRADAPTRLLGHCFLSLWKCCSFPALPKNSCRPLDCYLFTRPSGSNPSEVLHLKTPCPSNKRLEVMVTLPKALSQWRPQKVRCLAFLH